MRHFFYILLLPSFLTAWAPLIPKRSVVVTGSASYFDTDHFYDKEGDKLKSYNHFERTQASLLVDAGITNTDNLSFFLPYDDIKDYLDGDDTDIGDMEIGWKRSLIEWDNAIFSSEVILVAPLISEYLPDIRYGRWGVEGALMYAETFFPFGYKTTLDGRIGYRWYSGFPSDQIRSELSAWVDFSSHWQLLAQSAVEYGLFDGKEPPNHSFFFYNAKYRVWKGRVELNYYVTPKLCLTAGYMRHFMGQNIAAGGEYIGRVTYCF